MVVFPLKWLPYILIISGILMCVTGAGAIPGIPAIIIGIIWLKKKNDNQNNQNG